jgi:hypothetical protein
MSNADVLGRFVWHELLTNDTAGAAAFYPKVVPWRTAPSSMPGYTIWMAGQTQIGGLQALPAEGGATPPHWLIYVGTPNVDSTCSQAQGLGARIVKPPGDIPNVGRFAVLSDPQGATFAVFTPGGGPPPGAAPSQGSFSWHELATTDVAAAVRFYGQLFGWNKGAAHDMGAMGVYQIFRHAGEQVGGMCNVRGPSTAPSWLSYVHVADSGRAVAAAKSAGGRLLHGPMEVPGGSWIAMMMDPQGGTFAVQEAPRAAAQKTASAPKPAAAAKPSVPAKPAAVAARSSASTPAASSAGVTAAKAVVGARVAKRAKKAGRKMARAARKTARKTARKVRRAGRKVARRAARPAVRRAARKTARKTARAVRRGGRRMARRARVVGRRVRRAARRRR